MKKFRSLSLNLLWKITIIILLSFTLVGYGSIRRAKIFNRENMIKKSEETLNEILYIVANINSVVMQQMRMYTKFDPITSTSKDPAVIQKELIKISDKRYKDMVSVSYVDYKQGLEYFDDGRIEKVGSKEYFIKLKDSRIENKKTNKGKQKAGQMYTGEIEPDLYGMCKEADVFDSDGYTVGCFIGRVSISKYLQRFLDKLNNDLHASNSFPVILSSEQKFVCIPEKEKFEGKTLSSFNTSKNIKDYVSSPYEKDENGKKICISGDFFMGKNKYSITVGLFSKTEWCLGIITPYSTFDKAANHTVKFIIAYAIIAAIISLSIIYFCFWYEFRPLKFLNKAFKMIASGEADLTQRLGSKFQRQTEIGEIQKSFNEYLANLQGMVREISVSKNDVLNKTQKLVLILEKIKNEFENIDSNVKELKEKNVENDIIKTIDKASANLDFLIPELEVETKDIYTPLGKLSSAIDGFKYE